MLIDLAFLFRRSPHTESRSWSSAPQIFFRDASIVKFWVDTDTMFKITIWPIADADTDVFLLFIPPFVPGKQTLTPHARTQTRTSYTRTHDDTGRGFYDLYEINLFISTTAPSTFNIKIIQRGLRQIGLNAPKNRWLFILLNTACMTVN